jgi:APA family basic amino acid/polyamine antiporter
MVLTIINCLGVRAGSTVQSALMVLKIGAVLALVIFGLVAEPAPRALAADSQEGQPGGLALFSTFGAALVPVLFAYGGWQTANFIAGEVREPRKNLPRALVLGVVGVVVLYLSVNYVCVRVLGVGGLAETATPASEVMRIALGEKGARLIAVGIAISTLGFLSQSILTAPRVYFAMAEDRLFFKSVAWLHPGTRVPVVAIALQGALAIIIAASGQYKEILNYVMSVDSIFFGFSAAALLVLRRRERSRLALAGSSAASHKTENGSLEAHSRFKVPVTIIAAFALIEWLVAVNTIYSYPKNSAIGLGILLAGIPVYLFWRSRGAR